MPQTYESAASVATARSAGRAHVGWSSGERQTCPPSTGRRGATVRLADSPLDAVAARRWSPSDSRPPYPSSRMVSGAGRAGRRCGQASTMSPPAPSPMAARYARRVHARVHARVQKRCGAGVLGPSGPAQPGEHFAGRSVTPAEEHASCSGTVRRSMLLQLTAGGSSRAAHDDLRPGQRPRRSAAGPFAVPLLLQRSPDGLVGVLHPCVRCAGDRRWFRRDQYERRPDGARDCGCALDHLGGAGRGVRGLFIGGRIRAGRRPEPGGPCRRPAVGGRRSTAGVAVAPKSPASGGLPPSAPDCRFVGSAGNKPRKPKRRLAKVPKYEEPNTLPAQGLTGGGGEVFGSRYGHSADHHSGQGARPLRGLAAADLGDEAEALTKFFLKFLRPARFRARFPASRSLACCAVPSRRGARRKRGTTWPIRRRSPGT